MYEASNQILITYLTWCLRGVTESKTGATFLRLWWMIDTRDPSFCFLNFDLRDFSRRSFPVTHCWCQDGDDKEHFKNDQEFVPNMYNKIIKDPRLTPMEQIFVDKVQSWSKMKTNLVVDFFPVCTNLCINNFGFPFFVHVDYICERNREEARGYFHLNIVCFVFVHHCFTFLHFHHPDRCDP